jgi:hypothetical protein
MGLACWPTTSWCRRPHRSVASDNVLEQTDTTYDSDGNAIMLTERQRNHNKGEKKRAKGTGTFITWTFR